MESALHKITQEILISYASVGGLNHTDGPNLPSKRALGTICEALLQILFPGFHDEGAVSGASLPDLTRERVSDLAGRLEDEICKSLRITDPGCPANRAADIVSETFASLPKLREILRTDIGAAYEGDPAARDNEEIILSYPFVEAIGIQRVAHLLYLAGVPLLPRMMTEWAHARTGIDIHPGASIGSHFFIDHGTGVVIGETCRIGDHVKLYHGVTLGARSFQKDETGGLVKGGKRHPEVGDRVTIYPNSTILGGETVIGAGSTIAANVFLMQSVPPDSLVSQEEKRLTILSKKNRGRSEVIEWFI